MRNNGKYFEKKTHSIISKLNPQKDVIPDVRIVGKLSESSRQLDIVLKDPGEYDFIAFECKDEKASIGTPTVEGYATKLQDVGAKHGAIVSNSSFSRGARRMAAKLKIDLLNLVDTGDDAIKTKLFAPSALVRERVKTWGIGFAEKPPLGFPFGVTDFSMLAITLPDGRQMLSKELANEEWNKIADEPNLDDGARTVTVDGLYMDNGQGEMVSLPAMSISFDIELERRQGVMDITQSNGIYNVQDGSYQTTHLAIGSFSEEIFATWKVITKQELESQTFTAILHTRSDLRESHSSTENAA